VRTTLNEPDTAGRRRPRRGDECRAAALAALEANRGNVARTARQLGLPRKTLEGWARGRTRA
jgi:transcriptional regulator of acetoin/glycerol metabolism